MYHFHGWCSWCRLFSATFSASNSRVLGLGLSLCPLWVLLSMEWVWDVSFFIFIFFLSCGYSIIPPQCTEKIIFLYEFTLWSKWGDHRCVFLFYTTGLHVHFFNSTTLSSLLWIYTVMKSGRLFLTFALHFQILTILGHCLLHTQ
jgi:hypothetical protein